MTNKKIGLGVLVIVLAFSLAFSGCLSKPAVVEGPQKVISVTGLDEFDGKFGMLSLDTGAKGSGTMVAWSSPTKITGGVLENYMLDWVTDKPWGKDGTYMLILSVTETSDTKSEALFDGFIMSRQISGETVSVSFGQFTEL